jgi:hypothetical protein
METQIENGTDNPPMKAPIDTIDALKSGNPALVREALLGEKIIDENKPKLKKTYILGSCKKCKEKAIYIPNYKRFVCAKCEGLDGAATSEDIEDYLPLSYKAQVVQKENLSNKAILMRDPKSDPFYGLPGRNEPCVCKSGTKFKKCCLPKLEATRDAELDKKHLEFRATEKLGIATEVRMVRTIFAHQAEHGWKDIEIKDIEFKQFAQ